MDRRKFMNGFGAAALEFGLPAVASAEKTCKIIGVGGAGCNFVGTCSEDGVFASISGWAIQLIGIDSGPDAMNEFTNILATESSGLDSVVLVAGMGGETGSRLLPKMVRLAREAGTIPAVAVIMPFDFEGDSRRFRAANALRDVEQETGFVMRFSNQMLMEKLGDDIEQTELFAAQDKIAMRSIRDFLVRIRV